MRPNVVRSFRFVFLFVAYSLFHVQRKSLGNVKATLASNYHYSATLMGYLDLDFFISYGVAMYIYGTLIGRLTQKQQYICVGLSLLVTSVFTALMGVSPAPWAVLVLWGLATVSQAAAWPLCVSVVTHNFQEVIFERRGSRLHILGFIFGLFSLSLGIGNVCGGVLGDQVLSNHKLSWSWVFYITGISLALWGLVILLTALWLYPVKKEQQHELDEALIKKAPERLPFLREIVSVLRLPGVLWYASSNTCVKLVTYALMFSLPLYIGDELGYGHATSDLLANFFDVGTVIGSVVFGIVSDKIKERFGGRSVILVPLLVLSSALYPLLIFYAKESKAVLIVLLLSAGTLSGSAYNLIASAVSSDLGQESNSVAGVASIVTAYGSVGAGIGSLILGYVRQSFGWPGFLWALCVASLLSAALLLYIIKREVSNRGKRAPPLLTIQ